MASRWKYSSYPRQIDVGDRIECVKKAVWFAGASAPNAIYMSTGHELSEIARALIPGLAAMLCILGASTGLGAFVGGAVGSLAFGLGVAPGAYAGASAGFNAGLVILNYLGLAFLAAYIGGALFYAGCKAKQAVRIAWEAPEHQEKTSEVFRAADLLGEAVGQVFAGILQGVVAFLLAKGTANAAARVPELVGQLRQSKLGAGFAAWVEANWKTLIENPRLGGVKQGGQNGSAPFPKEMEPIPRAVPLSKSKTPNKTVKFPGKISNQMKSRGWTENSVNETINNPARIMKTVDLKTGDPATAYFNAKNHYVVVNNVNGEIVQVSNQTLTNWKIPSYFKE